MRSHSRKIIAAGVCLALLVGVLGTAVAAGKPPASNDQPAFTVFKVLHWVFRGVRHEVRRLGLAFEQLQIEFIDLDGKVDDLEVEILSERIEELEKMMVGLQFDVVDLGNLAEFLPPIQDFNEQLRGCIRIFDGEIAGLPGPHVLFEKCNVHVRSGELATDATVNGRGNLLVGYNEGRCVQDREAASCEMDFHCDEREMCVEGVCLDRTLSSGEGMPCFSDDECGSDLLVCDLSRRGGSHNLIVGDGHRYTSYAGVAAGRRALIGAPHASVCGGVDNTVLAEYAAISGGRSGLARGSGSSINGGSLNLALGSRSSILGGGENVTGNTQPGSTVSGGFENEALGPWSSISGGRSNLTFFGGSYASVSGGRSNRADAPYSSVSGGRSNFAGPNEVGDGDYSSISGGELNQTDGDFSSVSGGFERTARGIHDWVAGGASQDN